MTGIILSGGRSSRAGTNKALLKFGNKPLIQLVFELLDSIFSEVIISTNTPEDYPFLACKKIKDEVPGCGPLGGIHATLKHVESDAAFIISCDLPFINQNVIDYIVRHIGVPPVTIPVANQRLQPLCGCYAKEVLPYLDDILNIKKSLSAEAAEQKQRAFGMYTLLNKVDVTKVDMEIAPFYDDDLFFNLNTPQDYEEALIKMKKRI